MSDGNGCGSCYCTDPPLVLVAYNPFSMTTKQMIQDVGNAELFELFETDLKTQCTECLSYWSEGIVYCTCGHLLKEIVANRGFIKKILIFSQFQNT